jgi:hypothetical protein
VTGVRIGLIADQARRDLRFGLLRREQARQPDAGSDGKRPVPLNKSDGRATLYSMIYTQSHSGL